MREKFKKFVFKIKLSKNDSGYTLLELVVSLGITLSLTLGGLLGYSALANKAEENSVSYSASTEYKQEKNKSDVKAKNVSAQKTDSNIIEDSIVGLSDYTVFKQKGTSLSEGKTIAQKFSNTDIGITVIPESALKNKNVDEITQAIKDGVGDQYDTIIVVSDGKQDAFSVSSDQGEVEKEFNNILGQTPVDDAGWSLISNSDKLISSYDNVIHAEIDAQNAKFGKDMEAVGKVIGIIVLLGAGATTTVYIIRKRNKSEKLREKKEKKTIKKTFQNYSEGLINAVYDLNNMIKLHHSELDGSKSLERKINEVYVNMNELARIIKTKDVSESRRISVEVEYTDRLNKLNSLLGTDYYMNISKNPSFWNKADKRTRRVEAAVDALNEQILENIRQINEDKEIDFVVALNVLLNDTENFDDEPESVSQKYVSSRPFSKLRAMFNTN